MKRTMKSRMTRFLVCPGMGGGYDLRTREQAVAKGGEGLEESVRRAVTEVLKEQQELGLDVVTDGEMERGAYYMQVGGHHADRRSDTTQVMRSIEGIDMVGLEEKVMRSGAYSTLVPVVRSKVREQEGRSRQFIEWPGNKTMN